MHEAPEFSMHDLHEFLQAFLEFLHVWHELLYTWCEFLLYGLSFCMYDPVKLVSL